MKALAPWIGGTIALAVVVHLAFRVPLGWAMLAGLVGLPLIGILVTIDDDLPGGWSNPDGKTRPPWSYAAFWGELLLRTSLALGGFAIDERGRSSAAIVFFAAGIAGVAAGVGIMRRWPAVQA